MKYYGIFSLLKLYNSSLPIKCLTKCLSGMLVVTLPMITLASATDIKNAISDKDAVDLTKKVVKGFPSSIGPIKITSFVNFSQDNRPTKIITIIVGDSRVTFTPGVYSNCEADSSARSIRCDLRILDDLVSEFTTIDSPAPNERTREDLYRMIIAHELGHVVLKHGSARYHGTANGFSVLKFKNYDNELAADKFAVHLLDKSKIDLDRQYFTVSNFERLSLMKSLCPRTFPQACPCDGETDWTICSKWASGPGLPLGPSDTFPVQLAGTHPDYIVRFARMLMLSRFPMAKNIYGNASQEILRRVTIVNEKGEAERGSLLFQ